MDKKLVISPKKYKGTTTVISARIPDEMIEKIDLIGNKTGRNRNEVLMMLLEFALENVEVKEDA